MTRELRYDGLPANLKPMKSLLLIIAIGMSLAACSKDKVSPPHPAPLAADFDS